MSPAVTTASAPTSDTTTPGPTPEPGRATERKVPTRRITFAPSFDDVPRHFATDGDLIMSHVMAALSSVFPDGEDYFVRSVRHYRDRITDPELKRQVAGFIGQESVHGREHRSFNDRLDELGYPAKRVEKNVGRLLKTRERIMSPEANLATTAALEHFTATLAELVLRDEAFRATAGHPAVHDLFVWHALEEAEHKAVAFDVYKAIGGKERTRVNAMRAMRILFVAGTTLLVITSLLADRGTYQRGRLRKSWRHFKTTAFMSPALWRQLKDYDRPDFHPDDSNTDDLVELWRAELFGAEGTLNDKLATAA